MLTCQQLTELVTDYLEGRLSFAERVSFQMHIGMCAHCRNYFRQMKATVRAVGMVPSDVVPSAMRDELLARFRDVAPRAGVSGSARAGGSLRLLAALEDVTRGRRGWAIAGLIVVAAALVVLVSSRWTGPLGEGTRCLLAELGTGGVLIAVVGFVASSRRARLTPSTLAAVGMVGSLGGFAVLVATCDMAGVVLHGLVFHVGGIVLAGVMGLAASRLPAFR
jgi:predicted anti-sigma-YlaC factor YlaD